MFIVHVTISEVRARDACTLDHFNVTSSTISQGSARYARNADRPDPTKILRGIVEKVLPHTVHSSKIAYEGLNRGCKYKCRVNNTRRALFRMRDGLHGGRTKESLKVNPSLQISFHLPRLIQRCEFKFPAEIEFPWEVPPSDPRVIRFLFLQFTYLSRRSSYRVTCERQAYETLEEKSSCFRDAQLRAP